MQNTLHSQERKHETNYATQQFLIYEIWFYRDYEILYCNTLRFDIMLSVET